MGVLQVCICGILASAISGIATVGAAAPDELETLLRAVPSPLNKHTEERGRVVYVSADVGSSHTSFMPFVFSGGEERFLRIALERIS